jgi:hypothetical protein
LCCVRGGENGGHYKNCLKSHEAKWPLEFIGGSFGRKVMICCSEPGLTETLYIVYTSCTNM